GPAGCEPTLVPCSSAIDRHLDRVERFVRRANVRSKVPVPVAAFAAALGTAVTLSNDFGPDSALQGSGIETMATTAAVSRAGSIEVSSAPRAGRPVLFCARNSVLPG